MPSAAPALPNLTVADIAQGFGRLLPLSLFVAVFGLAYGLAAVQTGLPAHQILFMSAAVFAGTAQFAALELWGAEVAILPLLLTVFAINARHLLMGASLHPWLREVSPGPRYGALLVLSDANWIMSLNDWQRGASGLGTLIGGGLALWSTWVIGTLLGMSFGSLIAEPTRFGLDMVMGCFMLSMVAGGRKSLRILVAWTVAAATAWVAWRWLPDNTHVVVGAIGGGLVGLLWLEERPDSTEAAEPTDSADATDSSDAPPEQVQPEARRALRQEEPNR